MYSLFFELIQVAFGNRECLTETPTEKEWQGLYDLCNKQSVAGVAFLALDKLNDHGQKPPLKILYKWIDLSELIKEKNAKLNKESARLTSLFESVGCHSFILKGQANARLYNLKSRNEELKNLRQPGDIDIYIEGGPQKVLQKLKEIGLVNEVGKYLCDGKPIASYHHIDLPRNEDGIFVEVHYRPSSGLYNPVNNKRLQKFLTVEAKNKSTIVEEGFYVPNLRFALIMQLSHILHHVIDEGVGMRQVIDYYFLLKNSSSDRNELKGILRRTGLTKFAGALMWVLQYSLKIETEYLIVEPDEKRGRILLKRILQGGNFGHYQKRPHGIMKRYLYMIMYRMNAIALCPSEVIWCELRYIWFMIKTIPIRIQRKSLSLG